ncbi:MAG: 3'(2'),5'-bisphosphate nucleotidase CysQ [Lachnospiraceae bacterium]|jgi:3'(2'), 5'-bisphosphate nucleotidase|nr:3'(2'),5'-bisphosphate nucleotidase CysQ [Lachnospiraceae bacterium]
MEWETYLRVAVDAALAAGHEIMRVYEKDFSDGVWTKGDGSPLTQADLASNAMICRMLRDAFPDVPILSEEGGGEPPGSGKTGGASAVDGDGGAGILPEVSHSQRADEAGKENKGNIGSIGNKGNIGNIGNIGNNGNKGDIGDKGDKGDIGDIGDIGDKGDKGGGPDGMGDQRLGNDGRPESLCWVVDPLDGTKEFIKKNGQFTVNIGLVQDHHPVAGVVYVPVTGELFYAAQGLGAFKAMAQERQTVCGREPSAIRHESGGGADAATQCPSETETVGVKVYTGRGKGNPPATDAAPRRIQVSDKTKDLNWVGSKSHSTEKEQALIDAHRSIIREVVSAGSSLKGTMVAEGKADVYYRFGPTCEWDTCAMHCVAQEAGATVRQMDGSKLLYNRENHLNDKGFYIVNRAENVWV